MQPTVTFTNPGEIDIRAIQFMGVNAKSSPDSIGFFGTGLKYAIAVLLRERQQVTVYRGLERFDFSIRPDTLRGKEFGFVYMNEQPLGITTDLGKQWLTWMAFRELFSNALDEAGAVQEGQATPKEGTTTITVTGQKFHAAYAARGDYFILPGEAPKPLLATDQLQVLPKRAKPLYYRGIAVGELDSKHPHGYSYNLLGRTQLNEDRTLATHYGFHGWLANAIVGSDDQQFIEEFITGGPRSSMSTEGRVSVADLVNQTMGHRNTWEFEFNLEHAWGAPSSAFMLAADRHLHRCNASAKRIYMAQRIREGKSKEFDEIALTAMQQRMLDRAKDFIKRVGYDDAVVEVFIGKDLGENVLGTVRGKATIWLAKRVFEMGTKQVASTLLEEFIHLNRGFGDMQREMQNFLFDQIIGLVEELRGEPI